MSSIALKLNARLLALGLIILGALAILAFALFNPQTGLAVLSANAFSGPTALSLVAPRSATVGELIEVKLVANNVKNLAGFQARVSVDPTQLRITGAAILPDLSRGGRDILSLGPVWPVIEDDIDPNASWVAFGAATCPVADCSVAGDARDARLSLEGVSGRVELGLLHFLATEPGQYWVEVSNVKLVDPQGEPLDTTLNGVLLTVTK
jgi:hypothetical protein